MKTATTNSTGPESSHERAHHTGGERPRERGRPRCVAADRREQPLARHDAGARSGEGARERERHRPVADLAAGRS